MNCIIIDDNELAIETLINMLEIFCPNVVVLGSSQTIESGVKLINQHNPDVVFLDVEILNDFGFDLFTYFPNPSFSVIFTTAHEKYALRAIKNGCFDYLLKPIVPSDLVKTLHNLSIDKNNSTSTDKINEDSAKRIALVIDNEYVFLNEEEMLLLKADGRFTNIQMVNNQIYKSSKNLGEIEKLLSEKFFKCHKATIINIQFVTKFIKEHLIIVLNNEIEVELANRRKDAFLKYFNKI